MKSWSIRIALFATTCLAAVTASVGTVQAADDRPALAGFQLSDLAGRQRNLSGPAAAKLTVLVFLGTECPVSNGYAPALKRLYEAHVSTGVLLLGVHCDSDVSAEIAKAHAREYQLPFPLALDHDQQLASKCDVQVVPTAVVVDPAGRILYRGRIDNRYLKSGLRRPEATEFDLQAAIESALAGKRPSPAASEPFGCPLPPPRKP
jgi:peroxiredoxin